MRSPLRFHFPFLLALLILALACNIYSPELNQDGVNLPDGGLPCLLPVGLFLAASFRPQHIVSQNTPSTPGRLPHPPPDNLSVFSF